MKRIALIVAVEMFAVFERWGEPDEKFDTVGFRACRYNRQAREIIVIRSGPGQIAAAAAAQLAISEFHAEEIWNFGSAGAVVPELDVGDVCLVSEVLRWDSDIDYRPVSIRMPKSVNAVASRADTEPTGPAGEDISASSRKSNAAGCCTASCKGKAETAHCVSSDRETESVCCTSEVLPKLVSVRCASGDRVVSGTGFRRRIASETGAAIVEMEAAAIYMTAARSSVPCLILKGISDALDTPHENLTDGFREASLKCLEALERFLEKSKRETLK